MIRTITMSQNDYGDTATLAVNKYLWTRLQSELGWKQSDYGNLTPIFPVQEQPESISLGGPFIVYGYSIIPNTMHGLCEEQITYTIYSDKEAEVRRCVNFMAAIFDHYDWTAADINAWIDANSDAYYDMFQFKSVNLLAALSAQPASTEGGRMDGNVMIRAQYVRSGGAVEGQASDDPFETDYTKILKP